MSLLVGNHVQDTLLQDEEVTAEVSRRIYPIVIPGGVEAYPFIVYRNSGTSPEGTKDGNACDVAGVQIAVVAKKYQQALKVAQDVRYDLEGVAKEYAEFRVEDCELTGSDEDYMQDVDAYIVTLNMSFRTVDY